MLGHWVESEANGKNMSVVPCLRAMLMHKSAESLFLVCLRNGMCSLETKPGFEFRGDLCFAYGEFL